MPAQRSKHSVTRRHEAQTSWFLRTPARPLLALVRFASSAAALIPQIFWIKQLALVIGVHVYAALVFGRIMLLAARAV